MDDAELIDRLRGTYRHVEQATAVTAPPFAELGEPTARVIDLVSRAGRPRWLFTTVSLASAAAITLGAFVAFSGRGEQQTASAASEFRHAALANLPEGVGLRHILPAEAGGEVVQYEGGGLRISLHALRNGDLQLASPDVPWRDETFGLRDVEVGIDAERSVAQVRWREDARLSIGLEVNGAEPITEELLRELVMNVVALTDEDWRTLSTRSGFSPIKRCVTVPGVEGGERGEAGEATLELLLEGDLQRGVRWWIGDTSTALTDEVNNPWRLVRGVAAANDVASNRASSIFAHPGYPGVYVAVDATAERATCSVLGATS